MKQAGHLRVHCRPVADSRAVLASQRARFRVLTSRLLRLEFAADGHFEDRPSRNFWHSRQPVPALEALRND